MEQQIGYCFIQKGGVFIKNMVSKNDYFTKNIHTFVINLILGLNTQVYIVRREKHSRILVSNNRQRVRLPQSFPQPDPGL